MTDGRGSEDRVGKIERYLERAGQPEGAGPNPCFHDTHELQVRVPCKGRAVAEVLDELGRVLTVAAVRQLDPLIILEDLGLLPDSVASLVKGLCRLLVGYPRTVTFWESSGYAEAFLSVMDGQTNLGGKLPPL